MKFKLLRFAFFVFVLNSVSSYGQLLQWNTFGNAGTETTEASVANDVKLTASTMTLGAGVTAAANGNRFGGSAWWNTGNLAVPNGTTLAEAITQNDYIEFIVTPNPGFYFTPTSLVFTWDRSNTGPNSVTLRSSADGFTANLGSVTGMAAAITVGNTITISGLTNIATATTFRLYGYGGIAVGGTAGFDQNIALGAVNVVLNGTTGPCSDPTGQDTGIVISNRTVGGFDAAWTESASATSSLVVVRPTANLATAPTDNTPYTANIAWASAGQIDVNNRVVYSGNGASVTGITGLTAETQYTVMIYAFNGSGTNLCYRESTPLTSTFRTLATEPTAHPATFTCNTPTLTSLTLNFSAANTIGGDGYLILYREGAAPTGLPTDGVNYTAGSLIGNSTVHGYTPNSGLSTTYLANGLNPGVTHHFMLVPYNMSAGADVTTLNYRTAITIRTTNCTTLSLSTASDIVAVASSESATISSTVNNVAIASNTDGVQAWQITVRDGGGVADSDSSPTILTAFTIAQAAGNAVSSWSDAIFSIGLFDGATFVANGTVTATQITFSGLSVSVADGTSKTLSLRLSLKCPLGAGAVDGDDFGFSISNTNTTFSPTGSGKSAFAAATSANTTNIISVVATKLVFFTQPTNTGVNLAMSTVQVLAYDACNNLDTGFTGTVSLTSSGTMTAVTPVAAVAGVATFTGIVHTVLGTNLTLSATSSVTGATSTFFNIIDVTVFKAGDLLFVGYDGQESGSGASDEYLIATMVDIKPGTQFSIVNSRYEAGAVANDRTDKWGGGGDFAEEAPYTTLISYNGAANIPAGSVLVLTTDNSSNWFGNLDVITGTTTTNRTADFSGSLVFGTTFNPNISTSGSDQMYLIQGSFVSDGTIDVGEANYILSGTLLHGLTNRAAWVPLTVACNGGSSGGNTRESRLPAPLTCFNVESISGSGISGYYENDKEHGLASIRQIINAVGNVASNWTLGTARYNIDATSSLTTFAGKTFQIGPSNPAGSWVGDVDTNWFNCGNWEGLKVPDSTTDVVLNGTSVSDAIIEATATYANYHNYIATANDLNITTRKVQLEASIANILEVYGDLTISGSGALDMDDSNAGTADGVLKLTGNWTNSVGNVAFSEGNGTVEFIGTTPQIISSVAAEGTEIFYNVILDNDFDTAVSNDLIASGDLTIMASRDVSIDSNGYIKAYKKLDHSGNLTIENNGQFIQVDDSAANTGTYTGTTFQVKRNASVNKNDYVYWSSPTIGFDVSTILTNGYRFIWNTAFVNTNGTQGNWNTAPAGAMTRGKGYAIAVPNTAPVRPAAAASLTTTFTGEPHNGQFTVPIYRGNYSGADYDADLTNTTNVVTTKYDDNWNLVGNPYPSAISAEKFLDLNAATIGSNNLTISGTVWIWKHGQAPTSTTNPFYTNFVLNYYTTDYIKYNKMGATDTDFAGEIASGQGFMVNMKEGTGTLLSSGANTNLDVYESTITFNNSLRSTTTTYTPYDNSDFYRSGLENVGPLEGRHRIWLDIINNPSGQTDTSLLGYAADASLAVDNLYDAIFVPRGEVNLYSVINSNPFIIQGRPLPFDVNDMVPMGINIVSSGSHTVAIRKVDGMFDNDVNIYLEDKVLNIIHDLKQSPYVFTSEKGIFNDRFVLRYTNGTLGNPTFETIDSSVVVASNRGLLSIKSYIQTLDEVTVYDVLGRQLFYQKGIGNTDFSTNNISLSQQSVIVKIKLESGTIVTKKVLL